MEDLNTLLQVMNLHGFDMGSYYMVDVTHIYDPLHFYVRPIDYRNFLPKLQEHGEAIELANLELGMIVIFKAKTVQDRIRGRVRAINYEEGLCTVHALDFGFTEYSVPLKDMHKPLHNTKIPSLVTQCELAHCVPKDGSPTFSEEAIEAMRYYVGTEQAKILVRDVLHNKLKVDLINTCPDDIATILALTDYTQLGFTIDSPQEQTTVETYIFKHKKIQVNDVLDVRCQSGKSLEDFYVAVVDDYKDFIKERNDFNAYCRERDALKAIDVKPGVNVGAYSESTRYYERAIIIQITEDKSKAEVQLIDWGVKIEVNFEKLKAIERKKYFQAPACVIYCKAEEKQQIDELKCILYPGFQFQIKILTVGDKFDVPNIVEIVTPLPKN